MGVLRQVSTLLLCLASPLLLAQATYTTGFEQPPFNLGDVNGQDGWRHLDNSPTRGEVMAAPAGSDASFGAICGGEVTVLIEPFVPTHAIYLVGAGHCARAIAQLAHECGWSVTVIDDRAELLLQFPAETRISDRTPARFIMDHAWRQQDALIVVSRNYQIDRDALRASLGSTPAA